MIRILQMGMTDNQGGIETFLINYYRNIDKSKIQFDFTNIYNNKLCYQDEIEKSGGKIYEVSNYYKHPIKYIKDVIKIIKENNYSIVHCNMNSAVMIYPLIAAKIAHAKFIIAHSHNSSSDKGIVKKVLHNINRNFIPFLATNYWACSDKAGIWFFKKNVKSEKFKIINNAVDLNDFKYDENVRIKIRKELNIDEDNLVIGHVGRFNKQKNHEYLIEIFNQILLIEPKSTLLLIGEGPLKEDIINKANAMKIDKKIIFLGYRNDVNKLMMAMDCFVLPSLYEGLPLVGVEAQASGLPFICSSSITDEILLSDYSVKIDLSENPKKWADNILKMKNIKRASNKFEKFDIVSCTIFLEKTYENMIGEYKDVKKCNNRK